MQAEADALAPAVDRFGVTVVPTFVFVGAGGAAVRSVQGADAPALADAAAAALPVKEKDAPAPAAAGGLTARLQALTTRAPVMVFMKGTPSEPRCGFSRRVVDALGAAGVPFDAFDILGDADVRQGLKAYSDWPTYPQVYVKGELLGGCDIIADLAEGGGLKAAVDEALAA